MAEVMDQEPHTVIRTRTSVKTVVVRLLVLGVVAALAIGGYLYWMDLAKFESTDDAQVDGRSTRSAPAFSGHVIEVKVEDDQPVKAGDVLVVLDRKDYEVAVAKARADLADAVAGLQGSRVDVPITSIRRRKAL